MRTRGGLRLLGCVAILFIPILAAGLAEPRAASAETLRIGSINARHPAAEERKFLPLAAYLAGQLRADGLEAAQVVVARSVPEMAALLVEGKVDVFIDSPFAAVAVSRLSGSRFLLRRWKAGTAEYQAVIVARKDSGLKGLPDLAGRTIAFEEPFSTTGYFAPKLALIQAGLRVVGLRMPSDPVAAPEVGYVFTYSDAQSIRGVLTGQVAAAAMDARLYLKEAGTDADGLVVLHRGPLLPRHVVSHRADLPPAWRSRIRDVLLAMDRSEAGRQALADFERTVKFDELPEGALAPLLDAHAVIDLEFPRR